MALRIVNEDGNGYKTKVLDAETGEDLTNKLHVYDISLQLSVNAAVTAEMKVYTQKLDVVVDEAQVTRICPYCGHETQETIRSADDVKEEE